MSSAVSMVLLPELLLTPILDQDTAMKLAATLGPSYPETSCWAAAPNIDLLYQGSCTVHVGKSTGKQQAANKEAYSSPRTLHDVLARPGYQAASL